MIISRRHNKEARRRVFLPTHSPHPSGSCLACPPWPHRLSVALMARTSIPQSVIVKVLTEAGYRCAVPTCRTILAIDLHHIDHVSDGGGNSPDNLIALCPTCHRLYHRGEIAQESIRVWKGMLVALNGAFDAATIDDLIFLSLERRPRNFSTEAVLPFRRLIASGLAEIGFMQQRTYGAAYSFETVQEIKLTERGKLVLEAWREGDRAALARALSQGAGPGQVSS